MTDTILCQHHLLTIVRNVTSKVGRLVKSPLRQFWPLTGTRGRSLSVELNHTHREPAYSHRETGRLAYNRCSDK